MTKSNPFKVGSTVETIMGCKRQGTVVLPFYWEKSTDGTYKPPSQSQDVPIVWTDGTTGYANKFTIKVKQ